MFCILCIVHNITSSFTRLCRKRLRSVKQIADKRLDVTTMGEEERSKEGEEEAPFDHGLRADEAMKAFDDVHSGDLDLDEATENRLLRKIDLIILPVRRPFT